jgi:hypothetical protein
MSKNRKEMWVLMWECENAIMDYENYKGNNYYDVAEKLIQEMKPGYIQDTYKRKLKSAWARYDSQGHVKHLTRFN